MKNYISKIRHKIGHDKFIHPAARIMIENDKNEILFIERVDNGKLGIPAGALEENETIEACIRREVKEETNLDILTLEVIGISSNPNLESVEYPNGDKIQYFTIEFYSNNWTGELKINDKNEVRNVFFKDKKYLKQLPPNEQSIVKSLEYYQKNNKIQLK
jgi:ADP-ribose pyrophosphatase YjhB (NUDIX family)